MKKIIATLVLVMFTLVPTAEAGKFLRSKKPIRGRYLVRLNPDISPSEIERISAALAREHGGRLIQTLKHMRGFGAELTEGQARLLMNHPFVEQVEEDGELFVSADMTAARFDFVSAIRRNVLAPHTLTACPWSSSYYLCTFSDDNTWALDRIDNLGLLYSYKAYAYNSMGTGVRAYVVDSGVWGLHDEFDGRVETGANMMVDPQISDPVNSGTSEEPPVTADSSAANDPCNKNHINYGSVVQHGTAVASLIGGSTVGVAKNVTIVPVKVISCQDAKGSKLAFARGLDWIQDDMAARSGRAVVNMSIYFDTVETLAGHTSPNDQEVCEDSHLPGYGFTNCISAIEHEVNELVRKNIPVVTSANNQDNGDCTTSPARLGYGGSFPTDYHAITVGATTYTKNVDGSYTEGRFTNGAHGSNYGSCVSIWAPGAKVRVASWSFGSAYTLQTGGSSFAAAVVTGAVARLLQTYPTVSATQVWSELVSRANSRSVTPPDFDPSSVTNTKLLYISPAE